MSSFSAKRPSYVSLSTRELDLDGGVDAKVVDVDDIDVLFSKTQKSVRSLRLAMGEEIYDRSSFASLPLLDRRSSFRRASSCRLDAKRNSSLGAHIQEYSTGSQGRIAFEKKALFRAPVRGLSTTPSTNSSSTFVIGKDHSDSVFSAFSPSEHGRELALSSGRRHVYHLTLRVQGIVCGGSAFTVTQALEDSAQSGGYLMDVVARPEENKVEVFLATDSSGMASIEGQSKRLVQALEGIGFDTKIHTTPFLTFSQDRVVPSPGHEDAEESRSTNQGSTAHEQDVESQEAQSQEQDMERQEGELRREKEQEERSDSQNNTETPQRTPAAKSNDVELAIEGMVCTMCSKAVANSLLNNKDFDGIIETVKVSLTTDTAAVAFDETGLIKQFGSVEEGVAEMMDAVECCGFGVSVSRPPQAVSTDEETGRPPVPVESAKDRAEALARRQQKDLAHKRRSFLLSLIGTIPILLITMVFNYLPSESLEEFWKHPVVDGLTRESLVLWILCTPVQFICGWPFYKGAYHGFKSRILGMDTLIVIGTTAAYLYAVILVIQGMLTKQMNHGSHFFETSAVLITFVLLGKWLQAIAVRKTSSVLIKLMNLQGNTAVRVSPLGPSKLSETEQKQRVVQFKREQLKANKRLSMRSLESVGAFDPAVDPFDEERVPVETVQKGDILKIIRGASIPADGKVIHGEISVDEAMITGESLPVLKSLGADVLGGTVCNEGLAFMKVTGAGNDTALSQIVRLVEDAQMQQAPIQDFADKVSSIFVPAICTIALVAFIVWFSLASADAIPESWYHDNESAFEFALLFGIAVLVISCPCALGLAAPTAIMVGTGVGASHGVLIKGGEQLESASSITSVIFDKTGTLTLGKPTVTNLFQVNHDVDRNELLWFMFSAERNSEHPLATAIVDFAEKELSAQYLDNRPCVQPEDFVATTGRGVACTISGTQVAIGNSSFVTSMGISLDSNTKRLMGELQDEGKTAILATLGGKIAAVVGIADQIKPESPKTLKYLRQMGIQVWMVTGDNRRTAKAVADQVGLSPDFVIAEALPVAKLEKVKELQSTGERVAMVGDGINDSPALAQADLGVAIGTGDIAAEAADIVLVKGAIFDTAVALHLSRKIFNRIRLNFLWALVYNCLGIPVAAGVFYPLFQNRLPPTLAAAAMALSSICVVLSSLSLRWTYTPPKFESSAEKTLDGKTLDPTASQSEEDDVEHAGAAAASTHFEV